LRPDELTAKRRKIKLKSPLAEFACPCGPGCGKKKLEGWNRKKAMARRQREMLEMKDGEIMGAASVHSAFLLFQSLSKVQYGQQMLEDLHRICKGENLPADRIQELKKTLFVREDGTLMEDMKEVLLRSFRKDESGRIYIDVPWKEDSKSNEESIKRVASRTQVIVDDFVYRGGGDGTTSWERN